MKEKYNTVCECGKVKDISDYIEFIKGNVREEIKKQIEEIIKKVQNKKIIANEEKYSPTSYNQYRRIDQDKQMKNLFDICLDGIINETKKQIMDSINKLK
jgi:hypothetical protein